MELAGRFKCFVPNGFDRHKRRVLYVGKATAGEYMDVDVQELFLSKRSSFWSLARSISRLADLGCKDLSNIAWSNIFKQGVVKGNPLREVAEAQRGEAEEELRKEASALAPTLIVLVNAGYYEEIPKAAYQIGDNEVTGLTRTEVPGEDRYDLWSRSAYGGLPPIVWMYHPQGKRKQYLNAALALISQVTGW